MSDTVQPDRARSSACRVIAKPFICDRFERPHPHRLSLDNLSLDPHDLNGPMARFPHPKKDVEDALAYAESHGWRIKEEGSHAWGKMYCPYDDAECRCGEFCITGGVLSG